jgi:TolA-binding protein
MSYNVGRCYETLGEIDSAEVYYRKTLEELSGDPAVTDAARLRLSLIVIERDGLEAAMRELASPVPPSRTTIAFDRDPPLLSVVERLVKAYGLARDGYTGLGLSYLRLHWLGHMFPCDTRLMASDLVTTAHPDSALEILPGEAYCFDIFGAFDLMYDRAKYACATDHLERCAMDRDRFTRRFPLAQDTHLELDLRSLIQMFREGEGDTAGVMLDSLLASGIDHDLFADLLYRRGVHAMVARDFPRAIADFKRIEQDYETSDLYRDACFKLGTAYYMSENYDSSATYFMAASQSDKPALRENALFNGGLALEKAGDLDGAAQAFWMLAMTFPMSERFERSLMRSAYARERAGDLDEAIYIYKGVLQYAATAEAAAEAMYWIGESYSEMGDHLRAAVEFLRVAFLFPQEAAWAGTAAFQAGIECERAGLIDHALIVYRENVSKYGTDSDWGNASEERLTELEAEPETEPEAGPGDTQGSEPQHQD